MPKQLPPIDDDIYEHIQSQAVPLEDDVNSVLRRLLGLSERERKRQAASTAETPEAPKRRSAPGRRSTKRSTKRSRAPKGSILSEEAYEIPILRALDELGGRAPTSEAIDRVGKLLDDQLTPADHDTLASGDVRWRNRAQFVRLSLIKTGDMKADSPRGLWEISDQGRIRLDGSLA